MRNYQVIVVNSQHPMLDGVYIRPEGDVEQTLKLNPLAFSDKEHAEAFGMRLADLMNRNDL